MGRMKDVIAEAEWEIEKASRFDDFTDSILRELSINVMLEKKQTDKACFLLEVNGDEMYLNAQEMSALCLSIEDAIDTFAERNH